MQIKTYGSLFAQLFVALILIGSSMPVSAQTLRGCRDLVFTYDPTLVSAADKAQKVIWQIGCYNGSLKEFKLNKLKVKQERNVYFRFININPNNFSVNDKSTSVSYTIPNSSFDDFLTQVGNLTPKADDAKDAKLDSIKEKEVEKKLRVAALAFKSEKVMTISAIKSFNSAIEQTEVEPIVENKPITLSAAFTTVFKSLEKVHEEFIKTINEFDNLVLAYKESSKELGASKAVLSDLNAHQYSDKEVGKIKEQAASILDSYIQTLEPTPDALYKKFYQQNQGVEQAASAIKKANDKLAIINTRYNSIKSTLELLLALENSLVVNPVYDWLHAQSALVEKTKIAQANSWADFQKAQKSAAEIDWKKIFTEIWLSYSSIMQATNERLITKVAEGDKLDINLRVYRKAFVDNKVIVTDSSLNFRYSIRVKQGIKVSGSTGVGISSLFDQPYNYFNKDSTVAREATTRTTPLLTTMVHAQWRAAVDIAFGLSLGLGVPLVGDKNIHYLFGPSLFLGSTQRLIITAGLSATTTKTLGGSLAVGDKIPVGFPVPTQQNGAFGAFFSLSYNLNVNSTKP